MGWLNSWVFWGALAVACFCFGDLIDHRSYGVAMYVSIGVVYTWGRTKGVIEVDWFDQ